MNHLQRIRQLEADHDPAAWRRLELELEPGGERLVTASRLCFWPSADGRRAFGYWALAVESGSCGGITLEHVNAVVFYEMPAATPTAGWSRTIYIDRGALRTQRLQMENVLAGRAGAAFAKLERMVERRLPTRTLPFDFCQARGEGAPAVPIQPGCPPCGRPAAA